MDIQFATVAFGLEEGGRKGRMTFRSSTWSLYVDGHPIWLLLNYNYGWGYWGIHQGISWELASGIDKPLHAIDLRPHNISMPMSWNILCNLCIAKTLSCIQREWIYSLLSYRMMCVQNWMHWQCFLSYFVCSGVKRQTNARCHLFGLSSTRYINATPI